MHARLAYLERHRAAAAVRESYRDATKYTWYVLLALIYGSLRLYAVEQTGRTWRDFEKFVESPSSWRLVKNIRSLTIIPHPLAGADIPPHSKPEMLLLSPCGLPPLVAKLSKLSKLFLCNVTFGDLRSNDVPRQPPSSVYAHVEELFISSDVRSSPFALSDLLFLARSFSHVRTLTLRRMRLSSDAGGDNCNALPLFSLDQLKQLDVYENKRVALLLHDLWSAMGQRRLPTLTSLSVGRFGGSNTAEQLRCILNGVGDQLSSLSLHCSARLVVRMWLLSCLVL